MKPPQFMAAALALVLGLALPASAFTAVSPYGGPTNPLPAQVGTVDFSQTGTSGDAMLGLTGGKTYTFNPTSIASGATVYWGPQANGIKESFVNNPPVGAEIFTFSGTTASNVAVWTGQTVDPTNVNTPVYLRFTMTVTTAVGGQPVALVAASNIGQAASVGVVVPVTQGTAFNVNFIFEASYTNGSGYTPSLEFFNNIPFKTPEMGGTAQSSFSAGFYYNSPPSVTGPADVILNVDQASAALDVALADLETPNNLTLTASSSNQSVVADSGIALGGSGTSRTVTLTPVSGVKTGSATITLTVSDGEKSASTTFTATINQPPQLTKNAQLVVNQGATATFSSNELNATDATSADSGIIFTIAPGGNGGPPSFGTLQKGTLGGILANLGAGSTFTLADVKAGLIHYVNDGTIHAGDSFQFGFADDQGGIGKDVTFSVFTFSIKINKVNQPPKAVAATVQVAVGAATPVTLGVTDIDSSSFTFAITGNPTNGTVTNFNASAGTLTYTPTGGYAGTDSLTYTVSDGEYTSAAATVTFNVVNQPPTFDPVTFNTTEDTLLTGTLVASDPDLPAQTLTFAPVAPPSHGGLSLGAASGGFNYTPEAGYFGTDSFQVSVTDGLSAPVVATVTVNIKPVLKAGRLIVPVEKSILLADPASGLASSLSKDGLLQDPVSVIFDQQGQLLVLDRARILRIDPQSGQQTLVMADTALPSNSDLGPVSLALEGDGSILVNDGSSGLFRVDPQSGDATKLNTFDLVAGGVAVEDDGSILVTDVGLFTSNPWRVMRVNPATGNGVKIAGDNSLVLPAGLSIEADGKLLIGNVVNFADSNADDNILRITPVDNSEDGTISILTVGQPHGGPLAVPIGLGVAASGTIYAYSGSPKQVLSIDPNDGTQTPVTLNLALPSRPQDVLVLNVPVLAAIGNQSTNQGVAVTDVPITVSQVDLSAAVLKVSVSSSNTGLIGAGGLQVTGTGRNRKLNLTPISGQFGSATITVTASNGLFSTSRTFNLTVADANEAPVAVDDAVVANSARITIDVLANDSDPDGDALLITAASTPAGGTVTIAADGKSLSYKPTSTLVADDSFTYTISDGNGTTDTATVTVRALGTRNGLYSELLRDVGGTRGSIVATVAKTGAVSGKFVLDGVRYSFKGTLDASGRAVLTIIPATGPKLVVTLQLGAASVPTLSASIKRKTKVYNASLGYTQPYTSASPAPEAGAYTVLLPANPVHSADPAFPKGSGYATFKVSASGKVRAVGKTGDGKPFSFSSAVQSGGTVPVYARLYTAPIGILEGELSVHPGGMTSDLEGELDWTKPAQSPAGNPYPAGFVETLSAVGSRYTPAATPKTMLTYNAAFGASLDFSEGNLASPLSSAVTVKGVVDAKVQLPVKTLTFTPSNGCFTGSFIHPVSKKLRTFDGVVLQGSNLGAGFFVDGPVSGRVSLAPDP